MRNLNVEIDDAVYDAAKASAAEAGMLLRKWVERAIKNSADPPRAADKIKLKELAYEPEMKEQSK